MIRQYELVDMVRAYDPNVDESLLDRAYVFSMKLTGRRRGTPVTPIFRTPWKLPAF